MWEALARESDKLELLGRKISPEKQENLVRGRLVLNTLRGRDNGAINKLAAPVASMMRAGSLSYRNRTNVRKAILRGTCTLKCEILWRKALAQILHSAEHIPSVIG